MSQWQLKRLMTTDPAKIFFILFYLADAFIQTLSNILGDDGLRLIHPAAVYRLCLQQGG